MNGKYLGSHEGYFGIFGFNVTDIIETENVLVVRVDSPQDALGEEHEIGQLKEIIKGGIGRWDMNNAEINPGGIWNEVQIIRSKNIYIDQLKITSIPQELPSLQNLNNDVEAFTNVDMNAYVHYGSGPKDCVIGIEITPENSSDVVFKENYQVTLFPGKQNINFKFMIPKVKLWWTWDLGNPQLYSLSITVGCDGATSEAKKETFGVRTIERKDGWETFLNGVRIFQRGASYLSDQLMARMDLKRYEKDIQMMKNANLNTVQTFCNVEHDDFYSVCDRQGFLIYQVFPMWLMMSNSSDLVRRATKQTEEMINQLFNHPSIVIWTFGSQPSVANFEKIGYALAKTARELDPTRIINQANGAVMYVPKGRKKRFGQVIYQHSTRSFVWPNADALRFIADYDWRPDTHFYNGWYSPDIHSLDDTPLEWLQLVTEYGAQSLPSVSTLEQFIDKKDLFPPNWKRFARRGLQASRMQERVDVGNNIIEFIENSQDYQAKLIKYHTEFYRRLRFRPCNGAHAFSFIDCWEESISWSLVEYNRTPKQAYYALKQSMAPLQLFLDFPKYLPIKKGEDITLSICLVNDFPKEIPEGLIRIQVENRTNAKSPTTEKVFEIECAIHPLSILDLDQLIWKPKSNGNYLIKLMVIQNEKQLSYNQYEVIVE